MAILGGVADPKSKLPEMKLAIADQTAAIGEIPVSGLLLSKTHLTQKPAFGTLRGRIRINDPDGWKPMSQHDDVEAFIEGRL